MAYAPIAKLEKFTGEENNAQVWLNDIEKAIVANGWNNARAMQAIPYFFQDTANSWYQSLVNKPQDFNTFKIEFLRYFSNNNSINRLANTFITIKQEENEAVTTYLECFHRNLHQIQAINANYFTFIRRLRSNILQHIQPMHSVDLQAAITNARDFEAAKLEANHAQAINLIINGSSKLDSKLKQFSDSINQKLEGYLNQLHPSSLTNQQWQQETHVCHYCGKQEHLQIDWCYCLNDQKINIKTLIATILSELLIYDIAATLSTTSISNAKLSTDATSNLSATATTHLSAAALGNISVPTNSNTATELISKQNPKAKIDPTKLEIVDGTGSQQWNLGTRYTQNPNSQNYLSLLVTLKNTQPNNLETNQHLTFTSNILPATITENKSLDAIFSFKLKELLTMPLFSEATLEEKPITVMYTDAKVDGHSIKLILDIDCAASARIITTNRATKTPIDEIDNFPFEVNGIIILIKVQVMEAIQYQALKLQLNQNGQHTCVPATCGHFKTTNSTTPFINFEKEKPKPIWEAYQVLWADTMTTMEKKNKKKNIPGEPLSTFGPMTIKVRYKRKGKKREEDILKNTTTTKELTKPGLPLIKTIEQEHTIIASLWDNKPCLTCSKQLLDKRIWNDISGQGGTYNTSCQYMILISNWVSCETSITAMANAKIERAMPSKILEIKNNPPEPVNIVLIPNSDAFLDIEASSEEFHKHYQNLAPTKKEQEQRLKK
ncbi:hypothetical protein G9A89_009827 [Geosiphon pyriformis]|nr:hypothetical protein G9A89_009827 [Geosiphon pyriformis]